MLKTAGISRLTAVGVAVAMVASFVIALPASGAAKKKAPIKIGEATVLTGPAASYKQFIDGAVAYYDMVNARGGIGGHKIVVTEQDTGYTAEGSVRVLKSLSANNLVVQGLVSPAMPLIDATMAKSKVIFAPFADASLMTSTVSSPWPPNFFASNIYYSRLGAWVAKYLANAVNGGRIAMVNETGPTSQPGSSGFMAYMAKYLPNVQVDELTFSSTTTSLSSYAAQLQSSGVKGVYFWGLESQFVSLVTSMAADGYKPVTIGSHGLAGPATLTALGASANGLLFDVWVQPASSCAGGFATMVNKYFPGEVGSLTAQGWSGAAMIVAGARIALKLYGTINEKTLIKGLQHVHGTVGCTSDVALSAKNHIMGSTAAMLEVQNGQFVVATPFTKVPSSIPPIQ